MLVFYQDLPHFAVVAHQQHVPNVVSFQVSTRVRRWFFAGCYLALDDDISIKHIASAIAQHHRKAALFVMVDMSANVADTEGNVSDKSIAEALSDVVLEDMYGHFLPCRTSWVWKIRTWIMLRREKLVQSQTYYIIRTDLCLFQNVSVCDPRHNIDHYMVIGCLYAADHRNDQLCLRFLTHLPFLPPMVLTREDVLFA